MKFQSLLIVTAAVASLPLAQAGEPPAPAPVMTPPVEVSDWEFTGGIYSPMMGLEGDIGAGGVVTSVDISFDDILKELDGGATATFELRNDRWSLTGDLIWLKISASAVPAPDSYIGFREEEILASLALGYELYGTESTRIDFLAGAALTSLDVDLDLFTLPSTIVAASGSEEWLDPFVGLRIRHEFSDRWSVWARGDYGGFEVSSDEYWQAIVGISYRITECTSIALAYRWMGIDYQQGTFIYDTEMEGPNLGLAFRF